MKDKIMIMMGVLCIIGIWAGNAVKLPFYLNYSMSEPVGIYYKTKFDGSLKKGELVFLEVPFRARTYLFGRGWIHPGDVLLKNVGAIAGDSVYITESAIYVNGKYVGPLCTRDSQNRPLPQIRGELKIKAGHFLPIATRQPNSFDGRYFGPVSQRLILGKATPVITFD